MDFVRVLYRCLCFVRFQRDRFVGMSCCFFFFKQKTAYELRISDWSSDVCSSDLVATARATLRSAEREARRYAALQGVVSDQDRDTRRAAAEEARARLSQAIADRDLARINLERAEVRSPVNGIVTNFQLRRGIYANRSEEHTSELQSLMRISYAVFCLKKKK